MRAYREWGCAHRSLWAEWAAKEAFRAAAPPQDRAVRNASSNSYLEVILLLVNSAQTDAKIEIAIKITDEKALLISSNKICGINKHNIVIEIVVKDGVKKENGAIVKSL